jgi:TldD protein
LKRRDFIQTTGLGLGGLMLPLNLMGQSVPVEALLDQPLDTRQKKQLADVALNTARSGGATYADVRIGRYLNQFINTREAKVQNIVNLESFGVGIRVIVNGTWGFAATNEVNDDGVRKATTRAVAIAKANSKFQKEQVQLAPNPSHGEVSWKTPIQKNAFEVPVADKVALLLNTNAIAQKNGAAFASSNLFLVNEQKYFANSLPYTSIFNTSNFTTLPSIKAFTLSQELKPQC